MSLVLIVDDSPTEVHLLRQYLERHGYQTEAAEDGTEAVNKARELKPDLVLMDIVMPGMNGYQATRELSRDRPDLGNAPGGGRLPGKARYGIAIGGENPIRSRGMKTSASGRNNESVVVGEARG